MNSSYPAESGQVAAIVVTYKPDLSMLHMLVSALTTQVDYILIVNNGPATDEICSSAGILSNVYKVIVLGFNSGIAYAFNEGIKEAKLLKVSFVMLFDQDSIPSDNMVSKLVKAWKELSCTGLQVAAVGPVFQDLRSGRRSSFVRFAWFGFELIACETMPYIECDFLISSGSFYSMQVFDDIGCMDAKLFIDRVDTEWFLRARSLGYKAWGVCDAFMRHSIGDETKRIWYRRWRNVYLHRPFRYYYIFRNSTMLYKRGYAPAIWISGDMVRLVQLIFFLVLFSNDRVQCLRMIFKGIVDGLNGRGGNLSHDSGS